MTVTIWLGGQIVGAGATEGEAALAAVRALESGPWLKGWFCVVNLADDHHLLLVDPPGKVGNA